MFQKDEIRTGFCDEGLPQEKMLCPRHSVVLIDLVYRIDKYYEKNIILGKVKHETN